jgi:hypothetical protein
MRCLRAALISACFVCPSVGTFAQTKTRTVHVFVALADNQHQGIVPVPASLGNGDDPAHNLYWGAAFGVRTFFKNSAEWKEIATVSNPNGYILERSLFQHRTRGVLLVADAYRGSEIKQALSDFFRAAAGTHTGEMLFTPSVNGAAVRVSADSDLVVYLGHDGLMDFQLTLGSSGRSERRREVMALACASKIYFAGLLRASGAEPVLWTTGLMAPEAYTLKAALDGWILRESKDQIRQRAAAAYARYQKCSLAAALRLFSSGW